MGDDDVERRASARAAGFKERRLKPAAVLVRALEIHHHFVAAVDFAPDMRERWKVVGVLQHEGVRRAGIEPDIKNVVDLLPALVAKLAEEALARARSIPGIRALGLERLDDAGVDVGIVENLDRAVGILLDEDGNRHAPGALARDHPIGPAFNHAGDAVLALLRHPPRRLDRGVGELAQSQAVLGRAAQQRNGCDPWR